MRSRLLRPCSEHLCVNSPLEIVRPSKPFWRPVFSPEEIAAMSQEARQAPVCDAVLRSPHLRRLLSDTLSNTWAATQGVKEVAATRRGSKAGEPLADLAFGMLMRRILERVRERMDEKGIVARLPVCGATPFAR